MPSCAKLPAVPAVPCYAKCYAKLCRAIPCMMYLLYRVLCRAVPSSLPCLLCRAMLCLLCRVLYRAWLEIANYPFFCNAYYNKYYRKQNKSLPQSKLYRSITVVPIMRTLSGALAYCSTVHPLDFYVKLCLHVTRTVKKGNSKQIELWKQELAKINAPTQPS